MSLELIREAIKVNEVMCEDVTQTVLENDIIVPDTKPDIARILLLDGEVSVSNSEALQDKIVVSGTMHYKILYISADPEQPVKSINTATGYSYTVDIPGVRPGMKCRTKCDIEHMRHEIINERKINVKAILRISARAVNEFEQGIVCNVGGLEDIQIMKKPVFVNSFIGSNSSIAKVNETLDIPAGKPTIREILRNDVKITGKDYKLTDNKVIAKGEINVSTLYIGDDENGSLQYIENEIPFTQFIDLQGADENSACELNLSLKDSNVEAAEDNDGELRAVKCEIEVQVSADVYGRKELEVIEDAYSPSSRLDIEKEPISVEEFVSESASQFVIKDTIPAGDMGSEISEVFNVLCRPYLSQYRIENDKVVLEGALSNKVLYLTNNAEQPVDCTEQESPLNQAIDVKGIKPDMGCDAEIDIENCTYSMISAKEVEIRVVLHVSIRVVRKISLPLIKKVNQSVLDPAVLENRPSITIYFVQMGDTLWKVAKKYFTTMDEIMAANDLGANGNIAAGQQLMIPKRKA